MSNLLNKNQKGANKIKRVNETKPSGTYNPNDIFTVSQNKPKTSGEEITSIRLSVKNRDKIKALVVQKGFDSIDQGLDHILNHYEANMSSDDKKDWNTILKYIPKDKKK